MEMENVRGNKTVRILAIVALLIVAIIFYLW